MSEGKELTQAQKTERLQVIGAEIRAYTASMLTSIIEIGRRLYEAKELVPHGGWGDWVKENTGLSGSTANNFMRLYTEYGETQGSLFGASLNSQTFGNLSYSKALALLSISDPEEREKYVKTHDVESMSTRELQKALKERDEALKERDEAREAAAQAEEGIASIAEAMKAVNEEAAQAHARVEELENRPAEVVTKTVIDQAAIDRAVQAAKKEAGEKLVKAVQVAEERMQKLVDEANERLKREAQSREETEKLAEKRIKEAEDKAATSNGAQELEAARAEVEELRKKLLLADQAVTVFKVRFQTWQGAYKAMMEAAQDVNEGAREKLLAAVKAQVEAWGKESG